MNTKKTFIGAGAFLACLWIVVVSTYAAQVRKGDGALRGIPMQAPSSCSSSSSSGNE